MSKLFTIITILSFQLASSELTCNGVELTQSLAGSITSTRTPAGICFGSYKPDPDNDSPFPVYIVSSTIYRCVNDVMYQYIYGTTDCTGDTTSEGPASDLAAVATLWNITEACDLGNCNYVKIRNYGTACDESTPTFSDGLSVDGDCNIFGTASSRSVCNGDGTATSYFYNDRGTCNEEDPDAALSVVATIQTTQFTTLGSNICATTTTEQYEVIPGSGTVTSDSLYNVECGTAPSDGSGSGSGGSNTGSPTTSGSGSNTPSPTDVGETLSPTIATDDESTTAGAQPTSDAGCLSKYFVVFTTFVYFFV